MNYDRISLAIVNLDPWLESMRCKGGYGGPVSHWWQNSFQYTDAGLDWRYEGIIIGYLNLYEKTKDTIWLKKAVRAGNDLVNGQLKNGNFRNSSFEQNPKGGGTPHEAAADIGLLQLAKTLKAQNDGKYKVFLEIAKSNIQEYYIKRLWDNSKKMFRDSTFYPSFVPNKSATLVEALFLLAELTKNPNLVKKYAIPTVDLIIKHQTLDKSNNCYGGIYQMSMLSDKGLQLVDKIFPFYTARCIPALIQAHEFTNNKTYLTSAMNATNFIVNTAYENGSFPQVIYKNGKIARNPQWVAGIGDILRALHLMTNYDININLDKYLDWLLSCQDDCGGFRTANGFAVQTSTEEYNGLPEFRDILHVCGWNDKTFRFLTEILPVNSEIPKPAIKETIANCVFKGQKCVFRETEKIIELKNAKTKQTLYNWNKGEPWAQMDIIYSLKYDT